MLKNSENNGTEEFVLVTPTPARGRVQIILLIYDEATCDHSWSHGNIINLVSDLVNKANIH